MTRTLEQIYADVPEVHCKGLCWKNCTVILASDAEDAVQEAWVAHLEGKDVVAAVYRFAKREERWRKRIIQARDPST